MKGKWERCNLSKFWVWLKALWLDCQSCPAWTHHGNTGAVWISHHLPLWHRHPFIHSLPQQSLPVGTSTPRTNVSCCYSQIHQSLINLQLLPDGHMTGLSSTSTSVHFVIKASGSRVQLNCKWIYLFTVLIDLMNLQWALCHRGQGALGSCAEELLLICCVVTVKVTEILQAVLRLFTDAALPLIYPTPTIFHLATDRFNYVRGWWCQGIGG